MTEVTWNSADKSANVTLSNGDLSAAAGSWYAVRATASKSSGKWYYEVTISPNAGTYGILIVGWGSAAATLENVVGIDAYGWGWGNSQSVTTYHNINPIGLGTAPAPNDIIQIALDLDNGKIWWGKNGSWFGGGNPATGANPAYTGVSGTLFPMVSPFTTSPGVVTANFGNSAFAYTPPAGFSAVGTAHVWPTVFRVSGLAMPRHNPDFNGLGLISGTVKLSEPAGSPPVTYPYKLVTLIDKKTFKPVARTLADANGLYTFPSLNPARRFIVVAHDETNTYNAVIADNLTPI